MPPRIRPTGDPPFKQGPGEHRAGGVNECCSFSATFLTNAVCFYIYWGEEVEHGEEARVTGIPGQAVEAA